MRFPIWMNSITAMSGYANGKAVRNGDLHLSEGASLVGGIFTIEKGTGALVSWRVKGEELLHSALEPYFGNRQMTFRSATATMNV